MPQNIGTVAARDSDIGALAAIASDVTSLANAIGAATTYAVTVAQSGGVNVFYIDGAANPTLTLDRGNTYIFDQSDSSNSGHPLAFKDGSGNSYTTGVTVTGTAGQAGAKVTIDVASNAPSSLRYYCTVHGNAMGNTISVVNSNLATVASNITNVNNVGSNITNVNNVGGSITNIDTVATNLTSVNNFGDRYRVSANAPTTSLDAGDLWFDTTNNIMKVYGSSGFANAGSSVNGTSNRADFVVGTSSGGYNGSTTVFPITYDAGFVDVYLNGIKLQPADFTATNGTSVTLLSAAQTNDTVSLVAFGTFNVSNFSINDANDVNTGGVSNGQVLAFNSSTSDFEPTTISSDLVSDQTPQLGGTLDTNGQAIQFGSSKWTIELSGDNLLFKYNGTAKIKFASDGEIVSVDDVTGFGTI